MYHTVKDFLDDWSYERQATLKVFRNLTDASLEQRVTPRGRSLGRLAWHIVGTLNEMLGHAGLNVAGPAEDAPAPTRASDLVRAYESGSQAVHDQVAGSWRDADLLLEIPMYGETWKKRDVLISLVRHQAHHRAQMTVLMRQAGLAVPGIYGPAREEWAAMGMEPQQ